MSDVLVIAPGRGTRGGITSVVAAYEKAGLWKAFGCRWIESYIDKRVLHKLFWFMRGYLIYLWCLPACRLVHIHLSEPTSARRKSLFFWPAYWLGKKTVIHFHAFSPETTIRGRNGNLYRKLFVHADAVILLSGFWNREVVKTFGEGVKSVVIYNPFSAGPEIENTLPEGVEKLKSILYAGTLNRRKGFLDLIRAFSLIANEFPEWQLVLAGNGDLREGEELVSSLGLGERIRFRGWVKGAEKQQLFMESSIFCLPSYAEGFPMSVIEAWSYGLPVVTTPAGGLADVVEHRRNALVFQAGDIKGLADQLSELISGRELRSALSKESLQLSKDRFSIESISEEMADLYRSLLQE